MKKNFTFFLAILLTSCFTIKAGTPIIDGIYDAAEGWGVPVAVGDGVVGWGASNAKKFYITFDDNYVYFAAEVTAPFWQQFIIAVNTKDGGSSLGVTGDPWGRPITYNHTNSPDFIFRGDISQGNYAQYQVWDGNQWTGTQDNANASGNEVKSYAPSQYDDVTFVELRVPKATIGTTNFDAQFIISGNRGGVADGAGCYDAIPDDNNCTDWVAPNNASVLSKYISFPIIVLALDATGFSGNYKNGQVNFEWQSATDLDNVNYVLEQSANGNRWTTAGSIKARNLTNNASYTYSLQNMPAQLSFYRLNTLLFNGKNSYSKTIAIKQNAVAGLALLTNPVKNTIRVSVNINEKSLLRATIGNVEGKLLKNSIYQHPGGNSIMQIETNGLPSGMYILNVCCGKLAQAFKVVID